MFRCFLVFLLMSSTPCLCYFGEIKNMFLPLVKGSCPYRNNFVQVVMDGLKRVIHQDYAKDALSLSLYSFEMSLKDNPRPMVLFITGPTGGLLKLKMGDGERKKE